MIIDTVVAQKCCGCSACSHICPVRAIAVKENENGFFQAYLDESKCIQCGLCDRVCPSKKEICHTDVMECCAVKLCDDQKLMASQSGGAFFCVAEYIIQNDGVVYGVANEDIANVRTVRVDTLENLPKLQKSKYVQSDCRDSFSEVEKDLLTGRTVFYSGTACVIQGLKNYLEQKMIPQERLLTCDLICHGVPSRLVDRDYIAYMEKRNGKVESMIYCDKRMGWGSHKETFLFENKCEKSSNEKVIVFSKGYSLLPACFQCRQTTPYRAADITIGDFWSLYRVGMSQSQFPKGLSVCIVRNGNIAQMLHELTAKKAIEYTEIQLEDAMQWNLEKPSVRPAHYEKFWKMYRKNRFKTLKPVYFVLNPKEKAARMCRGIMNTLAKR